MKYSNPAGNKLHTLIRDLDGYQDALGFHNLPHGARYLGIGRPVTIGGTPLTVCVRAIETAAQSSLVVDFVDACGQTTGGWAKYVPRQDGAFVNPYEPYYREAPSVLSLASLLHAKLERQDFDAANPFGLVPASVEEIDLVTRLVREKGAQPYYALMQSDWDSQPQVLPMTANA